MVMFRVKYNKKYFFEEWGKIELVNGKFYGLNWRFIV